MSQSPDTFVQVERKYDFTLPSAYRSLADRGDLIFPSDAYLWVHEAEWLPPTDMLEKGGFWGNPKPGLVAFAFTGGRDLWAWQTHRLSAAGEPLIAYCPRDSYEGWWHAPSFLGWLYRVSLEYASTLWDEEFETKQHLRKWASVLREFQQHQWATDVESVAQREVRTIQTGSRGQRVVRSLIDVSDVNDRVRSAFGEGFIGVPYVWDSDGDQAPA